MNRAVQAAGLMMQGAPMRRVNGILRGGCALLLASAALLAGCNVLRSDAEPDRIYVLNPAPVASAAAPVSGLLMVSRPAVQPGLDTPRIALKRAGNELDYYALSRWSGTLPQILGAFSVESLKGSFTTVTGAERSAGPADFDLLLTARHFEAVYPEGEGAPEIHVAFDCLLMAPSPRRVIGSCDVDVREPAEGNRMSAIVAAFERAAQRALGEVREKALAAAASGRSSSPAQ